jgi:hypothetical protein
MKIAIQQRESFYKVHFINFNWNLGSGEEKKDRQSETDRQTNRQTETERVREKHGN